MGDLKDLKSHKDKKKAELVKEELEAAVGAMDLSIKALSFFGKYSAVAEAISSLKTNKTLLEIHLSKYTKLCE